MESLRQRCEKADQENDHLQRRIGTLNTNIDKLTKECDETRGLLADKELNVAGAAAQNVANSVVEELSLDETIIEEESLEEKEKSNGKEPDCLYACICIANFQLFLLNC